MLPRRTYEQKYARCVLLPGVVPLTPLYSPLFGFFVSRYFWFVTRTQQVAPSIRIEDDPLFDSSSMCRSLAPHAVHYLRWRVKESIPKFLYRTWQFTYCL